MPARRFTNVQLEDDQIRTFARTCWERDRLSIPWLVGHGIHHPSCPPGKQLKSEPLRDSVDMLDTLVRPESCVRMVFCACFGKVCGLACESVKLSQRDIELDTGLRTPNFNNR